jgi:O-acetylserine/cysteine efflux transporter
VSEDSPLSLTPAPSLSARDFFAAGVMNLCWGLNLIAVKMAVDLMAPMTAAWLRQVFVLIICLPALKVVPGKMRSLLALGTLSGGVFYIAVNFSMQVSDNVAALAIAGQLGAPFSLILAVVFLGERIARVRVAGMLLSFAGVVLLVFDPAAIDEKAGLALTAFASLVWAICSLILRGMKGVPILTIYAWVGLTGSTILLPIAWFTEPESMKHVHDLPLSSFGWLLFSALGSTVIGQGIMSSLLQRHDVSTIVPLTFGAPVIAVIASAWWFSRPLTGVTIVGGLIVMAGVVIVTVRTASARNVLGEDRTA